MKLQLLTLVLLVLVADVIRLPAQQTEAERKEFEATKAKAEKEDAIYDTCLQPPDLTFTPGPVDPFPVRRLARGRTHG